MYRGILEEALEKVHEHVGSPRGRQEGSYRSIGTFNILQVTAPEWGAPPAHSGCEDPSPLPFGCVLR
jgi:hypothetical protein